MRIIQEQVYTVDMNWSEHTSTIELLYAYGVIPVASFGSADTAHDCAAALATGGLPILEVTFRTAEAVQAIRAVQNAHPEILLGAGTLTTEAQLRAAVDAGAQFLVSPGLDEELAAAAEQCGVPYIPGVSTASEVQRAAKLGIDVLKFFPAEAAGGPKAIKALAAPFPNARFIPTGGISEGNIRSYLGQSSVIACGSSFPVASDLIASRNFEEVARRAGRMLALIHGMSFDSEGRLHAGTVDPGRTRHYFSARGTETHGRSGFRVSGALQLPDLP